MADERCETCRYWLGPAEHRTTDDGAVVGNSGRCRRYPPTLVIQGESIGYPFPVVRDDDWCGEWRGKRELTPPEPAILNEPAFAVLEMGSRLRKVAEQLLGTAATVRQVCDTPSYDWLTARNSGQATLDELRRELARHGLRLCDMPMWMPNS